MLWLLYLPVERRLFMIMMGEEADAVRRSDRKTVFFCSSAAVRISALFNGASPTLMEFVTQMES